MNELTKGEQAVALNYIVIPDDKFVIMKQFKSRIASIMDDMDAYKVSSNTREMAIAHTHLETAAMFLSKAIIKNNEIT